MFTAEAMCSPSRATLYTGLYPHKHGLHKNHSNAISGIKSLPHYLNDLGYDVVLAGKTHIKPESVFPFTYIDHDQTENFLRSTHDKPFCLIYASKKSSCALLPKVRFRRRA